MYELLAVSVFGFMGLLHTRKRSDAESDISMKVGDRIGKLWDIAHQGMRENRFLRAEKALQRNGNPKLVLTELMLAL